MLLSIHIENIAVIEKAGIDFDSGLTVLTGETGAGKSILIDSITAVLGGRTSRDIIRSGAKTACVSALFSDLSEEIISKIEELGYSCDDGQALISRSIGTDGKNICRFNGKPATVAILKDIGRLLINIHGQHDNQALLASENHIKFIDELSELEDTLEAYQDIYYKKSAVEKRISKLNVDDSEKKRRLDLLKYQIDELENANIRIGEWEELKSEKSKINNSEKILSGVNSAYQLISGMEDARGAVDLLEEGRKLLGEIVFFYPEIEKLASRLESQTYELQDIGDELRQLVESLEYNPRDIDSIEMRLDELYKLSLKYGLTEEDMLEYLDTIREEWDNLTFSEEELIQLRAEAEELFEKLTVEGEKLTRLRKLAGDEFAKKVCNELTFLEMPNVRFVVDMREAPPTKSGFDEIEFLISANLGELPKPLSKIASGGELSRIMLAIKRALAEKDHVGTLIFDEIDTGVSGRAAQKIGLKLKETSQGRQVICVTHSAQIAALADNHYLIEKKERDGRTYTDVRALDFEGRKHEIARIMGGLNISKLTLDNAEEMLMKNKG